MFRCHKSFFLLTSKFNLALANRLLHFKGLNSLHCNHTSIGESTSRSSLSNTVPVESGLEAGFRGLVMDLSDPPNHQAIPGKKVGDSGYISFPPPDGNGPQLADDAASAVDAPLKPLNVKGGQLILVMHYILLE